MLSWLFGYTFFSGPARNAPNEGVNIKELKNNNIVSEEVIVTTLHNLKKVEINKERPAFFRSPLLRELDDVFSKGNNEYFKQKKVKEIIFIDDT